MTGLRDGWQNLPRRRIAAATTSASGPAREDAYDAIPLLCALARTPACRVTVRGEDGATLALCVQDARRAFLTDTPEGWLLVLPADATRRRWVKRPVCFLIDEGVSP